MEDSEIAAGSLVRYPRTGTSGKVDGIMIVDGMKFARIDSSGMYYRIDQLIPVDSVKVKSERGEVKGAERFRNEEKLSSEDLKDAFDDVTGVGAG